MIVVREQDNNIHDINIEHIVKEEGGGGGADDFGIVRVLALVMPFPFDIS